MAAKQAFIGVPIAVYVVVAVGFALTDAPVEEDKPAAGLHDQL